MTMTTRAAKGGEFGANGQWYDGGRFINTIAENDKKSGSRSRKIGKRQVGPYKWEMQPFPGAKAIFSLTVGSGAMIIDEQTIAPVARLFPNGVAYNGETIEECQALCDKFNRGERWIA
jgi:hypothetical protein